jgi:hypothetical protein
LPAEIVDAADAFAVVLEEEYDFLLGCVHPPRDIGRNLALEENLFCMLVCVLNKIPLFVTGPPGCSKSLAFALLSQALQGEDAENEFLKHLPRVHVFHF